MVRLFTREKSRHHLRLDLRNAQISLRISLNEDYDVIIVRKKTESKYHDRHICALIVYHPSPASRRCIHRHLYVQCKRTKVSGGVAQLNPA